MPQFDPNELRLRFEEPTRAQSLDARPPRIRRGDRFLKGPIPLRWLTRAATAPARTLHVGIALWYRSGIERSRTVRLSAITLRETVGLDRWAGARGLRALEKAGLVSVLRHSGRAPVVTLLDPDKALPDQAPPS